MNNNLIASPKITSPHTTEYWHTKTLHATATTYWVQHRRCWWMLRSWSERVLGWWLCACQTLSWRLQGELEAGWEPATNICQSSQLRPQRSAVNIIYWSSCVKKTTDPTRQCERAFTSKAFQEKNMHNINRYACIMAWLQIWCWTETVLYAYYVWHIHAVCIVIASFSKAFLIKPGLNWGARLQT